jgi:hypothetical protein
LLLITMIKRNREKNVSHVHGGMSCIPSSTYVVHFQTLHIKLLWWKKLAHHENQQISSAKVTYVGPDVNTVGDKLANINTEIGIFMWKLGLQLTSSIECRLMKLLCYVSLLISLVVHELLKLDCIRWLHICVGSLILSNLGN